MQCHYAIVLTCMHAQCHYNYIIYAIVCYHAIRSIDMQCHYAIVLTCMHACMHAQCHYNIML